MEDVLCLCLSLTPPSLSLRCCVVAVCCKDFAWRGSRSNNSQITRNTKQTADRSRESERERETALGRSTWHFCNADLPVSVCSRFLCHSRECFVADNALPVTSPLVTTKACWHREKQCLLVTSPICVREWHWNIESATLQFRTLRR